MKSIRRFVYAAVLILSALNFTPSLASAQDAARNLHLDPRSPLAERRRARGKIPLHIAASGPSEMLTLSKISGSGAGFMMSGHRYRDLPTLGPEPAGGGLQARAEALSARCSFPSSELTLHFAVPAEPREVAQAVATSTASAAR